METSLLVRLVNQTGIESLLGGTPTQLPELNGTEEGAVSQAAAVVRTDKVGLGVQLGQSWAFVKADEMIRVIRAGSFREDVVATDALPDARAFVAEIHRQLPIGSMPQAAYASVVLTLGDAEDVYDQLPGASSITASLFLVSDGLAQEEAEVAFDTMRTASLAARISFMAVRGDELALTYGIWIGQDGDDVWMASVAPSESKNFTLETVMEDALDRRLFEGWDSLGLTS